MPPENQQNQQPAPQFQPPEQSFDPPAKSKKKKVLLGVIIAVLLVAVGVGAWWYGDSQATKKADAEVAELQSQIDDLKKQSAEADKNNSAVKEDELSQVEKDANEIHKALLADCNKDTTEPQKYVMSDESGQLTDKITPAILEKAALSGNKVYVRGYAAINHGCVSVKPVESQGGGFVAIMKRQADGTWTVLLGTQEILNCATIDKYKIPQEIQPECYDTDNPDKTRKNTN